MPRYYVHAPTDSAGRYLGAALTPPMHRAVGAATSRGMVYGQPGTQVVPVAYETIHQNTSALASAGTTMSAKAPNYICPALYWEADPPLLKERAPVSRVSDDQMPVPALRAGSIIKQSPYQARLGGQRQVVQPQVVPVFRGMYSGMRDLS